ncbi:MAG TPA: VOC family protein [Armatimonadota bacterium]
MRIDHLNIVVADIERSADFYTNILGLKRGFGATLEGEWIETATGLSPVRAQCVFVEPPEGGARIELLQYETPEGAAIPANALPNTRGLRHLAFTVDDADALLARLKSAGVELISPPIAVPFAVGSMGRKRLCYFHDPDGVLLEIAAYG